MQLTESYAYTYYLTPGPTEKKEIGVQKQSLAKGHKLVTAFSALASLNDHAGNPAASAFACFTEYTKNGQSFTDNFPIVLGDDVTEVKWNFAADKIWARAVFVIQCFD
jgi:hypothetical protein